MAIDPHDSAVAPLVSGFDTAPRPMSAAASPRMTDEDVRLYLEVLALSAVGGT